MEESFTSYTMTTQEDDTMATSVSEIMDQRADCGHRYGSLRFYGNPTQGGVECPTCGQQYPWHTPLSQMVAACRATAGKG